MNRKILILEALLALVIVLGFKYAGKESLKAENTIRRNEVYKNRIMIRCSPDWSLLDADSIGNAMQPLPGWGDYRWDIKTRSDSARFYFNQGINMYYAFHIIESLGSFKKAALFDSTNAMIYWGQALAYGPNINDFAYAAAPDALLASQKAKQYSGNCSAKEKALINAMAARYTADTTIARNTLNEAYSTAMQKAWKENNADADMAALYADARMLLHPWDYWQHNGNAQPWTPEIIKVIEAGLTLTPQHPGLNHYYIHMEEASPDPGKALASAKRLENMMPDVSHMVHMPSHIYIRTGKYKTGIMVNNMSLSGYDKYHALYPDVINSAFLYVIHNLHMKAACAMMMPDYKASIDAAYECAASIDTSYLSLPQPLGNLTQYVYLTPLMANVQYGKWEEIKKMPDANPNHLFATCLMHWAKGLALAETGDINAAKNELRMLQEGMNHADMQVLNPPFNKPVDQMRVGEKMLAGIIAEKQSGPDAAIAFLKASVMAEDALVYTEPRDWLIPARQFLANAYILKKDFINAEKILKEDLVINPHNYHSLILLKKIYQPNKLKVAELQKVDEELKENYNQ